MKEMPDSLSSPFPFVDGTNAAFLGVVRVEVRSLEDVLSEMERDRTGDYGNTLMIPSGMAQGLTSMPFSNVGDKKVIAF